MEFSQESNHRHTPMQAPGEKTHTFFLQKEILLTEFAPDEYLVLSDSGHAVP